MHWTSGFQMLGFSITGSLIVRNAQPRPSGDSDRGRRYGERGRIALTTSTVCSLCFVVYLHWFLNHQPPPPLLLFPSPSSTSNSWHSRHLQGVTFKCQNTSLINSKLPVGKVDSSLQTLWAFSIEARSPFWFRAWTITYMDWRREGEYFG